MITIENVTRDDLPKMTLAELEALYDEHHDLVVTRIVDGAQVALTLLGAEIYGFYVIRLQERLEKVTMLFGLYEEKSDLLVQIINNQNPRHHEIRNELQDKYMICLSKIDDLKKELGEMR